MKTINGIQIDDENNFPGEDGTGMNVTRRVNGYGIVTVTATGYVTYRESAEADSEICGRLGEHFKNEAELMDFIKNEFE
jgi:hypothetical protein